jgi:hypothetical protein
MRHLPPVYTIGAPGVVRFIKETVRQTGEM